MSINIDAYGHISNHKEGPEPDFQALPDAKTRHAETQARWTLQQIRSCSTRVGVSAELSTTDLKATMHHLLSTRRLALNVPLPIHRLPSEILVDIFTKSLHLWSRNTRHTYQERLYTLRCVSAAWRALIDNSPSLWTTVSYGDPLRTVRDALVRSGNSPFHVTHNMCVIRKSSPADFLVLVRQHVHRWRTFTVFGLPTGEAEQLLGLMAGCHAPELRELSIGHTGSIKGTKDFFEGPTRYLRRVKLYGSYLLPWNSALLSNLHALHLGELSRGGPSADQVDSILRASPALVELTLERFSPQGGIEPSINQNRPFALLSLKSFTMDSLTPTLTNHILNNIRIPNSEKIIIRTKTGTNAPHFTVDGPFCSARAIVEACDSAKVELGAILFDLKCWKQNKVTLGVCINGNGWEGSSVETFLRLLDICLDLDVVIDTKM